MSGVSGIFHLDGSPVDAGPLERMVTFLEPQGPHGRKTWVEGSAALGHTMFRATRESETEVQPCSLDGRVWIAADVFLVGREELVEALRSLGREVTLERPDPELILHAYHAWGEGCLHRLLGYFAFVLWDGPKRRVLAARDHFGNRTLYYGHRGPLLVLSGSLDAVAKHPGIGSNLSEFHVGSFLALGSTRFLDAGGSAYENIRTLRPAEFLVAANGGLKVERYWRCPVDVPLLRYRREEEVLEQYRALFARVIEDRLRSRRVVFTVSGGMDSTAVTAMAAQIVRRRGYGPEFVALCRDHRKINTTREASLAALLCRRYDIPLTLLSMDDVPWLSPGYSPVNLAMYPLMNQLQEYVRRLAGLAPVVMLGLSGDLQRSANLRFALSAGMPIAGLAGFVIAWRRHGLRPDLHSGLKRAFDILRRHKGHYARHFPEWLNPDLLRRHAFRVEYEKNSAPAPEEGIGRNRRHPGIQIWCEVRDRGTVVHGNTPDAPMEGLDPLGDKRIVEFLLCLPPLPWLANKFLQREAMRMVLPDEIRLRPREDIVSHHAPFLRNRANAWVDDWQPDPRLAPYLRRDDVPRLVGSAIPPYQALVHLRPWVLNRWLRGR